MLPASNALSFSLDWDKKAERFSPQQSNEHKKLVQVINQTFQTDLTAAVLIFSDNKHFVVRKTEDGSINFYQLCKPEYCLFGCRSVEKITPMSEGLSHIYSVRNQKSRNTAVTGDNELISTYRKRNL